MPDAALEVICKLLNMCRGSGSISKAWRQAIIIPVPKPGEDYQHRIGRLPYRLTSNLCKLIERIVTNCLTYYLEKEQILSRIQSGFRKCRSCNGQHVRQQTEAQNPYCNKEYMLFVFLDFEKAHDIIWRQGLLYTNIQVSLYLKTQNGLHIFQLFLGQQKWFQLCININEIDL